MTDTLLSVRNLDVSIRDKKGQLHKIVDSVSFDVAPGEVVALIGESGSGKSTISLACMGYVRPGCFVTNGSVVLDGDNVTDLSTIELEKLRGKKIAYLAQSAAASFNSAMTIDQQVIETAVISGAMTRSEALSKAAGLYAALDLPNPTTIGQRYPHQLSGGQLQRLMAAMAMMSDPKCLILDEPTTALDVTTQIEVLYSLKKLIRDNGKAAIFVTHDLSLVAQMADRVLVLKGGKTVEYGPTSQVISSPQASYTRSLMAATNVMPTTISPQPNRLREQPPLLEVRDICAVYGTNPVLNRINLTVGRGETLGIIGESGSGKTTLGRAISGLMTPKSGTILLNGKPLGRQVGVRTRDEQRQVQFAFQNADLALNPRQRIDKILGRPMSFLRNMSSREVEREVAKLLARVELPSEFGQRYPRELSGGQRQRVNLARALAAEPKLIICDEITSALDTIIAKQIMELLKVLQAETAVSYVFITHDLAKVAQFADRIAVMQNGSIVDQGPTEKVLMPPRHEYTRLLLNSVPELRSNWLEDAVLKRRGNQAPQKTQSLHETKRIA
jgi:peptide/nickel transport system ATP-binding protein